jgi:hypothetical protein
MSNDIHLNASGTTKYIGSVCSAAIAAYKACAQGGQNLRWLRYTTVGML